MVATYRILGALLEENDYVGLANPNPHGGVPCKCSVATGLAPCGGVELTSCEPICRIKIKVGELLLKSLNINARMVKKNGRDEIMCDCLVSDLPQSECIFYSDSCEEEKNREKHPAWLMEK